ncbi:MAG TPA: hypothetical protein PK079_00815 [Leptospiraceae bacterium]|nr:hypothetical protein [Leptospiraceae bacterium]HMW03947.1 hypothetical protein [Leptospiraceae bacterium]HMX33585.1 hypothetical protein [Leptospiraceae bacterium]HMY29927.1 hypothetical protein [Leptospiraceae bacterium]HMZ67106.1 hypothetical protein [Leptospiraceae bacterium]
MIPVSNLIANFQGQNMIYQKELFQNRDGTASILDPNGNKIIFSFGK